MAEATFSSRDDYSHRIGATSTQGFHGTRDGWASIKTRPLSLLLTVVIPTYSRLDLLRRGLDSIIAQTLGRPAVIVVDNASSDQIGAKVSAEYDGVRCVRLRENTFFAHAANVGARLADTPLIAVMNDDVILDDGWAAQALPVLFADPGVGSIASRVYQVDRGLRISSAGDHLSPNGWAGNIGWGLPDDGEYDRMAEVFSASGACALYRADAFWEAGGFDSRYTAYMEDVDLGFRLQLLGYRCVYVPDAIAYHVGGATPKSRRKALFLAERNMLFTIIKDFPAALLWTHRRALLRAVASPAPIAEGGDRMPWILGKLAVLARMPSLLMKRRSIQRRRRVSIEYLDDLVQSRQIEECHL